MTGDDPRIDARIRELEHQIARIAFEREMWRRIAAELWKSLIDATGHTGR